jgi:hypothetical protein
MYNNLVPKASITGNIRTRRQRRGNTLATGHRVAHIRWIIQIVGIAEVKSLKQKALSYVLRERVGIRISWLPSPGNPCIYRVFRDFSFSLATNWQRRKRGRGTAPSNPGAGGCSTAAAQGVTAAQIRERGEVNRQGQRAQASPAPFSLFRIIEKSVGFPKRNALRSVLLKEPRTAWRFGWRNE